MSTTDKQGTDSKSVYLAMSADFIHPGHLNIIAEARKLGQVTVGLLTDQAIAQYKSIPLLDYEQRKEVVENIKGVTKVMEQKTLDYTENILALKPDYVIHGDDWRTGPQAGIRSKVVDTLKQWKGELIEVEYSKGFSATVINEYISRSLSGSDLRRSRLKRMINSGALVKVLEAHNGLTGLIAENANYNENGRKREFDAMWVSSLTDSTAKGKPDIELIDLTSRLSTINDILEVTTKPIILDGDTGGRTEHFAYMVKTLERIGVSAVIIEDKKGLKKNSLFGNDVAQERCSIDEFSEKLITGKSACMSDDFMIIARIESFILGAGLEDALIRSRAYIKAGADGVMIHSKCTDPHEVLAFLREFRKFEPTFPVIVVPTTYNSITEKELKEAGVNVVIYANHMLRSAYPAMMETAEIILKNHRSKETDSHCMPIKQILELIPGGK